MAANIHHAKIGQTQAVGFTLEEDGFVHREAHPVIPPRVDYSLTPLGAELAERLLPVVDWIEEHAVPLLAAREARQR